MFQLAAAQQKHQFANLVQVEKEWVAKKVSSALAKFLM